MGVRAGKSWESYSGTSKRLIIAIDIGTTFSGAAYTILRPGEKPKIVDVGNYPSQQGGNYKVPSKVIYAADGSVLAIGSETANERIRHAASVTGAQEARWWKLALRRREDEEEDGYSDDDDDEEQAEASREIQIPVGKSAEDVFTDFLGWMVSCVEKFIATHHQGGEQLVEETRPSRLLVLSHPNGWSGPQQVAMRRATVRARAVADVNRATTLVKFVSEAEASLTYALISQTMSSWTEVNSNVVIVDAGGGTIDVTAYRVETTDPLLSVKEICIPQCLIEGAITVDNRAAQLIQERLRGTRWDNEEDLEHILIDFVRTVKHVFNNPRSPCVLKIGSSIDCDESIGLKKGMLVLEGHEVASLFKSSINATVNALRNIFADYPPNTAKRVALVGGYSENAYFRESIAKALGPEVAVAKPDNATSKAVANGAVAWAIDGVVTARISKLWYGVRCAIPFEGKNSEHVSRSSMRITSADGHARLPNAFQVLFAKKQEVSSDVLRAPFSISKKVGEALKGSFELIVYRGDNEPPAFMDDQTGFETLCKLEVDLSRLQNALPIQTVGQSRFRIARFEIHVSLLETELSARWVWSEQAIEHSGEAQTVYLDDLEFFTRKAAPPLERPSRPQQSVAEEDEEEEGEDEDDMKDFEDMSPAEMQRFMRAYAMMQRQNKNKKKNTSRVTRENVFDDADVEREDVQSLPNIPTRANRTPRVIDEDDDVSVLSSNQGLRVSSQRNTRPSSVVDEADDISVISSIRGRNSYLDESSNLRDNETETSSAWGASEERAASPPPLPPSKEPIPAMPPQRPLPVPTGGMSSLQSEFRDLKVDHQRNYAQSALQQLGHTGTHAAMRRQTMEDADRDLPPPPPYLFFDAEPER